MTEPVALVTCGPPDHGIVRFGRTLSDAALGLGFQGLIINEADPSRLADVADRLPSRTRLVHLQVNDWLFADPRGDAGHRIAELAAVLGRQGRALTVTLHDLPQTGVSPQLYLRRARIYSSMSDHVRGIVVASEHERDLLADAVIAAGSETSGPRDGHSAPQVEVIPLPVCRPSRPASRSDVSGNRIVGIFGFIYPGKGHHDVLSELGTLDPPVTVRAIGRPSDGHEWMLDELRLAATRSGVGFECTGYVSDDEIDRQLRSIDVPIAPHPQVSASASINSWIGAGRRPLVLAGRYTRELDRRMPGAVALYEPGRLGRRVSKALNDFRLTALPTGTTVGPSVREMTAHYLRWLERKARQLQRS